MELNKKNLITLIVSLTFGFIIFIYFVEQKKSEKINSIINNLYVEKKDLFLSEKQMIFSEAELIKDLIFDKKIISMIEDYIQNPGEKTRDDLIVELFPKYLVLKKYKVSQFHLMLPNGASLIRFNDVNKFGDIVNEMAKAANYIKFKKEPFSGFILTKEGLKFVNIFPLYKEGIHLANIEIAFNYRDFLMHVFNRHYIAFLIDKKLLPNSKMPLCKLNPNYVIDGDVCKYFNKVHVKVDFNKHINILGNYIVFSYPIYSFNKKIGYFIKIIPISSIKEIKDISLSYTNSVILIAVIYFIILFFLILYYRFVVVKRVADLDKLTQIYNRRGCEKFLKSYKDYSIILIDIDHFKQINDTYGHDIGDKILQEFGKLLKSSVRANDIVCRWGGEEFLIILPHTSYENATEVAEKIRKKVEETKIFGNIQITISLGVSQFNGNFEKTFKEADEKLYIAKKTGRNKVIF
ncbi:MAG: diguanylate cyclase [Epsilonproteobacteria bacterium]|nr:diguanylate cyclase [Campylobacterota bacterium]